MSHPVDDAVRALSARQYDCFSRAQILAAGGSDQLIARRVASGTWIVRADGVYGFGVRQPSWRMGLMVAHLAVGLDSVVSFEAAGALFGLGGFPEDGLVVTVRHPSHRKVVGVQVTVHQTRRLPAHHVTRRGAFPVTSLPRTFVDLASFVPRPRLNHALEGALSAKQVSLSKVSACLAELAAPNRRGLVKLGSIIDDLSPGEPVPGSEMEWRFLAALRAAGEPLPRRQYPHPGRLPTDGCVDFAYPAACLICEIDGRKWHTRKQDLQRDHARDMAAARAGWDTLRVLHEDLHDWPEDAVETVRTIRLQREAVVAALRP